MPEPTRCPACGAAVRDGQPWCTQCWAPLAGAPTAGAPAAAAPVLPGPRAEGATGGAPPGRGWPCTSCGSVNDLALDACTACGTGFLAAGEVQPALVLPLVGDVLGISRGRRLALAGGVAVLTAALLLLLVAALGALL